MDVEDELVSMYDKWLFVLKNLTRHGATCETWSTLPSAEEEKKDGEEG